MAKQYRSLPFVLIVILAYNVMRTIRQYLDSILQQHYPHSRRL
jgi:glycosyltransferase involved in cell wall biosynthesis